ncbi:anti-sigma factor [Streptomyces sp. NPDC005574]|uniref:anti-sigma factor n=1 Tax=Streptomyces sp. NPDC005574 TaxID=3156891 RepID=UPI0033ACAE48
MITADLHTLSGAYALHALAHAECAAFERHLAGCPACAQEVAEFTATAARLGLAASEPPRPAVRADVLRRIVAVRQESPGTGFSVRAGRATGPTRPLPRWMLAACLAAAAVFGGTSVWQYERAQDARDVAGLAQRGADDLAAVLAAPDVRTRSAGLPGGARGTVVVSASRDAAVFVSSGLAEPPRGKVYQLWFDDGGTMRSAGLMDPRPGGRSVLLDGPVGRATGMGITVEPAGGSAEPTSAPLALMDFPA